MSYHRNGLKLDSNGIHDVSVDIMIAFNTTHIHPLIIKLIYSNLALHTSYVREHEHNCQYHYYINFELGKISRYI